MAPASFVRGSCCACRRCDSGGVASTFTVDVGVRSLPPSLHAPADRFIGREQTMTLIRELIADREHRLITIVGPPGAGKTRVALETINRLPSNLDTIIVDLSATESAAEAMERIAASLASGPDMSRDPATRLMRGVERFTGLLLLDNVEQVRDIPIPLAAAVADSSAIVLCTRSCSRGRGTRRARSFVPGWRASTCRTPALASLGGDRAQCVARRSSHERGVAAHAARLTRFDDNAGRR